jgi:hypothetical protein
LVIALQLFRISSRTRDRGILLSAIALQTLYQSILVTNEDEIGGTDEDEMGSSKLRRAILFYFWKTTANWEMGLIEPKFFLVRSDLLLILEIEG